MADAGSRRNHAEVVERLLTPFEESVPLHVPLILTVHIHLEGTRVAKFVNHHRVVDDQIDRVQRVDLLRIAAERHDPVAHGRKVNHGRNAGEVLHQHAGGAIRQLTIRFAALLGPVRKCLDVVH
jgi:hypothetical protein